MIFSIGRHIWGKGKTLKPTTKEGYPEFRKTCPFRQEIHPDEYCTYYLKQEGEVDGYTQPCKAYLCKMINKTAPRHLRASDKEAQNSFMEGVKQINEALKD